MAMVGVTESCKGLVAGDESHADAREGGLLFSVVFWLTVQEAPSPQQGMWLPDSRAFN